MTKQDELNQSPEAARPLMPIVCCAECARLMAENEALQDKLWEIRQWCNAYPLDIFPKPNLKKARELLEGGGLTLDIVSASAMRHVLNGIVRIIGALDES